MSFESGEQAQPRPGLPGWLKLVVAFGLALVTVLVVPRVAETSDTTGPTLAVVLGTCAIVALLTGLGMYLIVQRDLRLGSITACYAAGFSVLVVVVKFLLAPLGLYEVNRARTFETFSPVDETGGAMVTAGFVLLLYLAVYWLIYRLVRGGVARGKPPRRKTLLVLVVGSLLLVALGGGSALIIVLLLAGSGGLTYLEFVFSSSLTLLIGVVLAVATSLVALCLRETRERARLVGDASVVVGMFWLGLAFLALYHVLWVVYILVLTTLWPLKVVTPK